MKRFSFIARLLLSAVLLVFLILSPAFLAENLSKNRYREFLSPQRESWTGILTVWHVAGFKTFQGSITSFLQDTAGQYEKSHAGIYVKVVGLDPADAAQRLQRGEKPDIWSFPSGFLYAEQLKKLDPEQMNISQLSDSSLGDDAGLYAIPYLYSCYFLVENTQAAPIASHSEDFPGFVRQLQTTKTAVACDSPLPAAFLGLCVEPLSLETFHKGNCAYAILDARKLGDLTRSESQLISLRRAEAIPFTDMVQYLGLDTALAPEKEQYALSYINLMLAQQTQAKITALGAFPMCSLLQPPTYASDLLDRARRSLKDPLFLHTFAHYSLQTVLTETAQAALRGDTRAASDFQERLREAAAKE